MMATETRHFDLSFPQQLVREPLLHNLASKFRVVPNISAANVDEDHGFITMSLSGAAADLDAAIAYLTERGVNVRTLPAPVNA